MTRRRMLPILGLALLASSAMGAETFDSAGEKMHGLVPIKDTYGKTKTAGLGWHVYPEPSGCRLVKPPVICSGRNDDLVTDVAALKPGQTWEARPVDCGLIVPPAGATLKQTVSEWARATFVFTHPAGHQLRVTASRLSPAVLVEVTGPGTQVFAGAGPARFASAAGKAMAAADLAGLTPADLSAGWLLAWFGQKGATPSAGPDPAVTTMWDVPILIVFSESVSRIQSVPGGGWASSSARAAAPWRSCPCWATRPSWPPRPNARAAA